MIATIALVGPVTVLRQECEECGHFLPDTANTREESAAQFDGFCSVRCETIYYSNMEGTCDGCHESHYAIRIGDTSHSCECGTVLTKEQCEEQKGTCMTCMWLD